MKKSNIAVDVCLTSPAVNLTEERKLHVLMTQNGHLHIWAELGLDDLTFSRVECKTLWQVMKRFAEKGNLEDFK